MSRRTGLALAMRVALVAGAIGGAALLALRGDDASVAQDAKPAALVASARPSAEETPTALPDGIIPSAIRPEPRETSTPLCDADSWSRAAELVREIGAGEVVVSEPGWQQLGSSARVGVASWLSKCKHEGEAVRIRGDDSGELLATYDAQTGYRALN